MGLLQEIKRVNEKLVKHEQATKEVIFGADYEISKIDQQLAEAESNRQVAKSYFNFLLNRNLESPVELDNSILESLNVSSKNESLASMSESSLTSRKELKQIESGLHANQQSINLYKANKYPK